jgi:plasmid maintenance system antidote protein VapI
MTLKQLVENYLIKNNLTQGEFSTNCGLSEREISCIMNEKAKFTMGQAVKLSKILCIVPKDLYIQWVEEQ